jgi:hypothetical protein
MTIGVKNARRSGAAVVMAKGPAPAG